MSETQLKRWPQHVSVIFVNFLAFLNAIAYHAKKKLPEECLETVEYYLKVWLINGMATYSVKRLGRKTTLSWLAALLVLALTFHWVFSEDPDTFGAIELTMASVRVMAGCEEAISIVILIYSVEIAQKESRGRLVMYYYLFHSIGLALCSQFALLYYNVMYYAAGCCFAIYAIAGYFIPESPNYYIEQNKANDAEIVLKWLRGEEYNAAQEVEKEMSEQSKHSRKFWKWYSTAEALHCWKVAHGLLLIQLFIGMHAKIMFFPENDSAQTNCTKNAIEDYFIFESNSLDEELFQIIYLVLLLLLGIFVEKFGRKNILLASVAIMAMCIGAYAVFINIDLLSKDRTKIATSVVMIIHVVVLLFGWMPAMDVLLSELLPSNIKAVSITVVKNIQDFLSDSVSWYMEEIKSEDEIMKWLLLVYAILSPLAIWFIYKTVPDTRGRTLRGIQRGLTARHTKSRKRRIQQIPDTPV